MMQSVGQWLRAYAEREGRGYPDWALRYEPIVRRLRNRIEKAQTVVEIGANANGLAVFAHVPVVAVDVSESNLRDARMGRESRVFPVLADATALPFAEGSIDVVVCIDTFEHLPPAVRDGVILEIGRALKHNGAASVAFPAGQAALKAEHRVAKEYRQLTGRTLSWFEEHAAMGLPEAARVAEIFESTLRASHTIARSPNAPIALWVWMWRVLLCGWPGRGNAVFQALLKLAVPLLSRMHFGVCYRTIVWVEPREE